MDNLKVSISPGNAKLGAIPSVSLPPLVTCAAGVPCLGKCYARRMCRRFPNVKEAYARNWRILQADPDRYWAQVQAGASVAGFFRYHVAGDIPDGAYLDRMVDTAHALPRTRFLVFTKKYGLVNEAISRGLAVPDNLQIIFSKWGPGWEVDNPHGFPETDVIFRGQKAPAGAKVCGGNCTGCACRGVGCWELKPGETLYFYEH